MMSALETLLSRDRRRFAIIGAAAVIMAVVLVSAIMIMSAQEREPIYRNLSISSANAIQIALAGAGFDAQLSTDQSEVSVPRTDVARARMVVAEMGMPIDGEPGWEIFDNSNALAMNSFMQRVNRLRAMEGELARSIQTLNDVQSARVHLVMPEREPFSRTKPEPRASVIVRAAVGRAIERRQAIAIRALVASAVPELNPEHVTVLTAKGETILGEAAGTSDADRPIQAARAAIEDRLARQVEDILSARVGAGNARVRVNVDLTTAREVVIQEIFDPDQQVVRSTENTSEKRDQLERGGNIGVENNIPPALQDGGTDENGRSSQENVGESVNYEIGSTRREIVREAGEVERISVAVLVNGIYSVDQGDVNFTDRSAEELEQLNVLVRTAVGFNEQRGDTVSVASLRFMDYSMEVGEPIKDTWSDQIVENIVPILRSILVLVVISLVLLLGVRPLLRKLDDEPAGSAVAALPASPSDATDTGAASSLGEPGAAQLPAMAEPPRAKDSVASSAQTRNMPGVASVFDPEVALGPNEYLETMGIRGRLTRSRVEAIHAAADQRPDEVLRVLRSWLSMEAEI